MKLMVDGLLELYSMKLYYPFFSKAAIKSYGNGYIKIDNPF